MPTWRDNSIATWGKNESLFNGYYPETNPKEEISFGFEQNPSSKQLATLRTKMHYERKQAINSLTKMKSAMEQTQNSQQLLQNWDKQMGLKRSHSKVMCLSSKSRKQLKKNLGSYCP